MCKVNEFIYDLAVIEQIKLVLKRYENSSVDFMVCPNTDELLYNNTDTSFPIIDVTSSTEGQILFIISTDTEHKTMLPNDMLKKLTDIENKCHSTRILITDMSNYYRLFSLRVNYWNDKKKKRQSIWEIKKI